MKGRMNLRIIAPSALASVLLAAACSSSSSSGARDGSAEDAHLQDVASSTETGADTSLGGPIGDASFEAATMDAMNASEASGPPPACGAPPDRFTLLTGANAGLVQDNVTGLIWMSNSVGGGERVGEGGPQTEIDAASYCSERGMRLPTKAEALALATADAPCTNSYCMSAGTPPAECLCESGMLPFGGWGTWTSTFAGEDEAFVVDYCEDVSFQVADNFPNAVLCVRDSPG